MQRTCLALLALIAFAAPLSAQVHECFGFNLVDQIESYSPPDMTRTPTQVFTSIAALQSAVNAKEDHGGAVYQLAAGTYTFGSTGIRIYNKQNLTIYSDPANRAVLDGRDESNFAFHIREDPDGTTDSIQVIGFEITRTKFHGIFLGNDSAYRIGSNIYVGGNYIHHAANVAGAGITVRSEGSQIVVEANTITAIDEGGTGSGRGEGIYLGQGSNPVNHAQDVVLRGNIIYDLQGEAIDVKRPSRDVLIEYNRIDDISVHSQGAITLALDNLRPNDVQSDVVVRYNVISNVDTLQSDGNAIVAACDALIEGNIMFNIGKHAVDVYNDANGPDKTVTFRNNIMWNYVGLPIRENIGNGNRGPNNPFIVVRENNLVQSDPAPGECLGNPADFVGPLTSLAGFAPVGPPNPDPDGDGMPTTWEVANGLDPNVGTGIDGASADKDGDGFSNFQEYIADTHPGRAADFLSIKAGWVNDRHQISLAANSSRVYTLQSAAGPKSGIIAWTDVAGFVDFPGTPGANDVMVLLPPIPSEATRCYRVQVTCPSCAADQDNANFKSAKVSFVDDGRPLKRSKVEDRR